MIFSDEQLLKVQKLPIELSFEIAKEKQTIKSREGDVVANKGDAILTGTKGEKWPIEISKFEKTYSFDEKTKKCSKKPLEVEAIILKEPIEITVSWSNNVLKGKKNDVLVKYSEGDFGIVSRDIFDETYEEKK